MSIIKRHVISPSTFVSFFIVMTHNSSINFKVMPFLLWTNESHQSPNFESFKSSGENLPNFSRHFSNHKSVFLQNVHKSSISWKINFLYFCSSSNIYLAQKELLTWKCLRLLSAQVKIRQNPSVNFENTTRFLSKFCIPLRWHER